MTVRVKFCVGLPALLVAVNVRLKVPATVGVPPSVAVPFPLSVKVTPLGRAPDSLRVGVGKPPVVVTLNDSAVPTVNVLLFALVNVGTASTTRVPLVVAEPT